MKHVVFVHFLQSLDIEDVEKPEDSLTGFFVGAIQQDGEKEYNRTSND